MTRDILIYSKDYNTQYLTENLYAGDYGYRIVMKCAMDLTGCSVNVCVLRSDEATVTAVGECEGKSAYCVLPQNALSCAGKWKARVCVTDGSHVVTVAEIIGNVAEAWEESEADSDDRYPILTSLISQVTALQAGYDDISAELAAVLSQTEHYVMDLTKAGDTTITADNCGDYQVAIESFVTDDEYDCVPRVITVVGDASEWSSNIPMILTAYSETNMSTLAIENYSPNTVTIAKTNEDNVSTIPSGAVGILIWSVDGFELVNTLSLLYSGAVKSTHLASGAVTSLAIASSAVVSSKINTGAVTSVKIADGAVTNAKIANLVGTETTTGSEWGYIPYVMEDGGIELGQYADFHLESADGIDREARIRICDDDGTPRFKLEGSSANSSAHLTVKNLSAEQYHGTYYGTFGYPLVVTLNGTAYTYNGNSANATTCQNGLVFYAPSVAGDEGYVLLADETGAPAWSDTLPYSTKFKVNSSSSAASISLSALYSLVTTLANTVETLTGQLNGISFDLDDDGNLTATK